MTSTPSPSSSASPDRSKSHRPTKSKRGRRGRGKRNRSQAPFAVVEPVWQKIFPQLPLDIPRITLAAWLANDERLGFKDPCWLALIAPSSSAKTVILSALADATEAYPLDTLTAQTFHSGMPDSEGKPQGLLYRLGRTPKIVIKDLSAILSKQPNQRDEIMGQLRTIADGDFTRATGMGTDESVARWKGRMTLAVGMTTAIDIYHALHNQLGERFLRLRFGIDEDDLVAVGLQALENERMNRKPQSALASVFKKALDYAGVRLSNRSLSAAMDARLANLVAFISKARTGVVRDAKGEVQLIPQAEGPGRLIKQLQALACALAALRGTSEVTDKDYKLVERVAFSSIPEPRGEILWALYNIGATRISEFKQNVKLSDPTIRRHLEDLELLGLAEVAKGYGSAGSRFSPSKLGLKYLKNAGSGNRPKSGQNPPA